jgi:uncharacterized membrane protein
MKQKLLNNDLFLMLIIAMINIAWACVPIHIALIGIIVALPLVFLVPGCLLIELLMQKQELDRATRLLLSIGLSLSIDIISGFLLNVVPPGLTAMTWGIFLSFFTIMCVVLCMVKRRKRQVYRNIQQQKPMQFPLSYTLLLLLTACIVVFAFVYTTSNTASQKSQGFTQFWLLLDNHQLNVCAVQFGISSNEATTTTYQIDVKENGQSAARWSSIQLGPQHKWQRQLAIATNSAQAIDFQIEADLYRQQEPGSVYRTVQIPIRASKRACTQK